MTSVPTDPANLTALILTPDNPVRARIGGLTVLDRAVRVLTDVGVGRILVADGTPPDTALPTGRYLLVAGDALFDGDAVRSLAAAAPTVRAADAPLALTDDAGAADALAGKGLPETPRVPVRGYTATLTGRAGIRRVERDLWRRYGPKPSDGLVCRYLNRPLSRPVTLLLLRTGVTPDMLSVASFLVAVAGAALAAFGGMWWTMILAGVLIQAGNALDGVDGETARVSLRSSRRGALLDTVLDRYADLAVIAGLALAAGGSPADWIWGFAAGSGAMLISYINALAPAAPRRLLRRDVRLLLCAVAAACSLPLLGLVVIAVLTNIDAVRVFAAVIRRAPGPR